MTLWGLHWLREQNVTPSEVRYISAADSVARLLASGEAAVGFMSSANWEKLPDDLRAKLRVFAESRPMAGRVYLLDPRHADRKDRILAALDRFAATDAGARYFDDNKLGGYRPVAASELDAMTPYADEVRKQMNAER